MDEMLEMQSEPEVQLYSKNQVEVDINNAVLDVNPVDTDQVISNRSGWLRTTWTTVKAFLKTYFDTVYQATLISGTNIKTINGSSILGNGDLTVESGASLPLTTEILKGDGIGGAEEAVPGSDFAEVIDWGTVQQWESTTTYQIGDPILVYDSGVVNFYTSKIADNLSATFNSSDWNLVWSVYPNPVFLDQSTPQFTSDTEPQEEDEFTSIRSGGWMRTTWANIKSAIYAYLVEPLGVIFNSSHKNHGIESTAVPTFDPVTHVVSVAGTVTYWSDGAVTEVEDPTCDLDDYVTLTANTLYYVYFDGTDGTLQASTSIWNLKTVAPLCTVFWNGSVGAVNYEAHNHTRNIDWHINAHLTIGARYGSGLTQTNPTTTNDGLLQIETGVIHDEDIISTTGQQTTCRVWYKVNAGQFTFVNSALPYAGSSGQVQYLDTDTYLLTNVGASRFACMWVYAGTDTERPIYIIPTHAATDYVNVAAARAETAPSLSGLGLNPEMKLIYRWIYRGDGQYQEGADYRLTSPLPSGGSPTTSAGAVTFVPSGNIASANVQAAIEELDSEKQAIPTKVTGVTLSASGWSLSGSLYQYDYSNATILSTSIVDAIPANASVAVVTAAQIMPRIDSSAGSARIYAANLPTADITVDVIIWN